VVGVKPERSRMGSPSFRPRRVRPAHAWVLQARRFCSHCPRHAPRSVHPVVFPTRAPTQHVPHAWPSNPHCRRPARFPDGANPPANEPNDPVRLRRMGRSTKLQAPRAPRGTVAGAPLALRAGCGGGSLACGSVGRMWVHTQPARGERRPGVAVPNAPATWVGS
jgi:hypothetical protein